MQTTFRTEEEAAAYWLDLLRDGTARQRARARTELGLLLEQRGLLDEAADAYRANVEAGVADRRPYERLAAICRQRGDHAAATMVLDRMASSREERAAIERERPRRPSGPVVSRPFEPASQRTTGSVARPSRGPGGPIGWAVFGGAAAIGIVITIIILMVVGGGGSGRWRLPFGSSQMATCADGARRFPGASDPVAAVTQAYERNGVAVDPTNGSAGAFMAVSAPKIIGGWIAVSLLREQEGESAPSLSEWLSREPDRPTLMNLLLAGRALDRQISVEEWEALVGAPADSCEGAFIHDPKNVDLVQLVALIVDE